MTSIATPSPLPTIPCKYGIQHSSHFLPTTAKLPPFRLRFSLNNNNNNNHHHFHLPTPTFIKPLILLTFSFTLLSLRLCSRLLLPDFSHRWKHLIAFSSQAEAQLIRSHNPCPQYLFQAVVAYEDRRFFSHFGVDPIGVARAIFSLSALGGGSTITQQLVKNAFLKNERTFLRKFIELVLAVALEQRISKLGILSAYLCKIYWGHGIYGIESASNFYFGKHPSLLSLGECALLVGMIPAPELRSPFKDSRRGKPFQARVLKRMVDVDFIDIETALLVVNQSVNISDEPDYAEKSLFSLSSFKKQPGTMNFETGSYSTMKEIWDWERESKIWEVREDMERWAMNLCRTKKSVKISYSNYKGKSFQNSR